MHLANTLPRSGVRNKWRFMHPLLFKILLMILTLTAVFTRSLAALGIQKAVRFLKHWHLILLVLYFLHLGFAAPGKECIFKYIVVLTVEILNIFG